MIHLYRPTRYLNNTVENSCFEGNSIADGYARYYLDVNVTGISPFNRVN
jgi:hypothetical protein